MIEVPLILPSSSAAAGQTRIWRRLVAGVVLAAVFALASLTAIPTGQALAAPALPIRIGLAWDRWAAECAGRPIAGIQPTPAMSRWPDGAGGTVDQAVSPAPGSYLVGTGGPAVVLAVTDSGWLARSVVACASRASGREGESAAASMGFVARREGPSWYCMVDPAAGDAATLSRALTALTQVGWPAYLDSWLRSPGAPGPGGDGVAVALDGGLAGVSFAASFPVSFAAPADGSLTRHEHRPYRGTLQVIKAGERGLFSVVNRLDIEEYLLGVVPSEMPAAWPLEALKAQAVAARTYAVANLGKHSSRGFDLCHDIHCQAYLGFNNEYPGPSTAVKATAGVVATYGGRLINAVYHAHSGGATDSSAVIWGSAAAYLAGTSQTYEKPYYWTATNTRAEVERVVAGALTDGVPDGLFPLLTMTPTQFTAGNRALRVNLAGPGASAQMTSSRLRSGLGTYRLRDAKFGAWGVWIAALWPDAGAAAAVSGLEPVVTWAPGARGAGVIVSYHGGVASPAGQSAAQNTTLSWLDPAYFVFSGQGFGHGVGMSQWGAREMAAIGKSYREILSNFYRGIALVGNYGR